MKRWILNAIYILLKNKNNENNLLKSKYLNIPNSRWRLVFKTQCLQAILILKKTFVIDGGHSFCLVQILIISQVTQTQRVWSKYLNFLLASNKSFVGISLTDNDIFKFAVKNFLDHPRTEADNRNTLLIPSILII